MQAKFSRLLAGELYTSTFRICTARASLCSAVMWRLLATHSILLFPLHFSARVSPCAITFQTQSTYIDNNSVMIGISFLVNYLNSICNESFPQRNSRTKLYMFLCHLKLETERD